MGMGGWAFGPPPLTHMRYGCRTSMCIATACMCLCAAAGGDPSGAGYRDLMNLKPAVGTGAVADRGRVSATEGDWAGVRPPNGRIVRLVLQKAGRAITSQTV